MIIQWHHQTGFVRADAEWNERACRVWGLTLVLHKCLLSAQKGRKNLNGNLGYECFGPIWPLFSDTSHEAWFHWLSLVSCWLIQGCEHREFFILKVVNSQPDFHRAGIIMDWTVQNLHTCVLPNICSFFLRFTEETTEQALRPLASRCCAGNHFFLLLYLKCTWYYCNMMWFQIPSSRSHTMC